MSTIRSGGALWRALIVPCLLFCASAAHADFVVPAGGSVSLGGGTIDLGCTDLSVGGNQQINSGSMLNTRNLSVQSGGVLDGGSGNIALVGNWSNSGTFNAGSGTVAFSDNPACATSTTITGTSTFANLSLISANGKTYTFAAGLTQSILDVLTIQGTSTTPIVINSSIAGQQGNIFLAPGGTQNIQYVSVTDNYGTGQILAPTQQNQGGGGKVRGWFGIPLIPVAVIAQAIPALDAKALLLLLAMVGGLGMLGMSGQRLHQNSRN
ncbi:hypothetical protein ELE36_09330 [Pseudolysobacter antarcticus]|uniref:IPTL-CTERM sorting domain-containing protein n=1 Tax=Pseudolysobacter antarcticus TaxID=2511995 RepID=A0A411HJ39_9GAMM|nr:hypothetical protein [Pseudolysobacter antarcticus]QBB70549.1 hypothetical protein ELE36_09330 [Pseudolysobacter antarcticus]